MKPQVYTIKNERTHHNFVHTILFDVIIRLRVSTFCDVQSKMHENYFSVSSYTTRTTYNLQYYCTRLVVLMLR